MDNLQLSYRHSIRDWCWDNTFSETFTQVRKYRRGRSDERSVSSELQGPQPFRQALIWTTVWISLAAVFAVMIFLTIGYNKTLEFISVYAIEKGLSVDNMFVFLLIFSSLGIPHNYEHKILMTGILGAICMRIALILAGISLLESFHWMIYIFGGLLVITGLKMLLQKRAYISGNYSL